MTAIVTKESLQAMLNNPNAAYVDAVIGRALMAIAARQTSVELATASTTEANNVGFAGADARSGTLTAKYYAKHKRLLDWQRAAWLKPGKSGFARIAKYHRQLNEIAEAAAHAKP